MKIKLINYGYKRAPFRAHVNDAGADVYATTDYIVCAHETIKIPLGFGLQLPDGYAGFIFPRSSLSNKSINCQLPPIDSGYTGEIHAIITNNSNDDFEINKDDRIGQLVIIPIVVANFVTETGPERGSAGFGSTGK